MAYTYIQSEKTGNGLWTVGFYKPDGEWVSESDHFSGIVEEVYKEGNELAAARVHYLNGGNPPEMAEEIANLLKDKAELLGTLEIIAKAQPSNRGQYDKHDAAGFVKIAQHAIKAAQ